MTLRGQVGLFSAFVRLARPGNAFMASLGVVAGALAAADASWDWARVLLAALAAAFGVAGGNALNDALDARIDRVAHRGRPVASGVVSSRQAVEFSAGCFGVAYGAAALVNAWALLLALALSVALFAYEAGWKRRGLVGNVAVSAVVASTFLLGGVASVAPSTIWGWVPAELVVAALVPLPLWMAAVALLANLARELYKDLQDAVADRGERTTFPHRHGGAATRRVASLCLAVAVPLTVLPVLKGWFGWRAWGLLAPSLGFFLVAATVGSPSRASLAVKLGMALAVVGFVILGLI